MMRFVCLSAIAAMAVADVKFSTDPNMNGEYIVSKTPNAPGDFPTDFKDYPGGVEYFDVYHGPITSLYSQVYWTTITNALPNDIVQRFKGKVMAIVGMESDQVRKTPDGDVSVPISMAYNHHHDTAVVGTGATMVEVEKDMNDPIFKAAGRNYVRLSGNKAWVPVEHTKSLHRGAKSSAMFSDGNGGEYRKTFHAYAPPFVQLVDSPQTLSGSPMQIDTWNRDKMSLNGSKFVPGPVPFHNLAPLTGPDAIYSGLLECPLTTRIQKIFDGGNGGFNDTFGAELFACTNTSFQCGMFVQSADDCFAAVKHVDGLDNVTVTTKTTADSTLPAGCSVAMATDMQSASVVFNTNNESTVCCGGTRSQIVGAADSLVQLRLSVDGASDVVTITMTGPSQQWYGVGFDATLMGQLPYTITVDGVTGAVTERKLANHMAGTVLNTSVKVVSNTVSGSTRTVVLTRPLKGLTRDHYTFDVTTVSLGFINAVGTGATFAYHKASAAASIQLWPANAAPACICSLPAKAFGQGGGMVKYLPTGETVGFPANRCNAQSYDILNQRNPTCDLRTYVGGLSTCHHGWSLLDADQDIPWQDQPLVYYKKFRIYFQEYNASFHKPIQRHDWGIGADGDHAEYDVPQCEAGTPTSECNHTISGVFKPVAAGSNMHLVLAHFHCHAPTCLKMELWNNDTGELLCRQLPVYGGTGEIDDKRFDEAGYIAQPPCMWGSPEHGLEPPPLMSGMTVKVVAVTNNTYGHHGEMALPEMSLVQMT